MTIRKQLLTGSVVLATAFVASHEGLRLSAYYDPVGIPTVCYGSTAGVHIGQTKTNDECDELLENELQTYAAAVDRLVYLPLPDTRKAALISFTYNVGIENFRKSTLLKKLNAGNVAGACNELPRWVYARGIKWPGLVKRRAAEQDLCLL